MANNNIINELTLNFFLIFIFSAKFSISIIYFLIYIRHIEVNTLY